MVRGTTKSGFAFCVNERIKNDYRFVRAYKKSQSKNEDEQLVGIDDLLVSVLGEDGAEKLCDYVAEEDGFIPTDRIMEELAEILLVIGKEDTELKNL